MKNLRAHIFIEGRVQEVGFRWWTAQKAKKMGLAGWVRNLSEGEVEAVVEGKKTKVDLFRVNQKWIKPGKGRTL